MAADEQGSVFSKNHDLVFLAGPVVGLSATFLGLAF